MAIIIDDILLAPCKLVHWLGKKLHEQAEHELTDESAIRQKLLEAQIRFEFGEISKDEFRKQEDDLMAQLEAIREYKKKREADQGAF